jgi:hypothetical protein
MTVGYNQGHAQPRLAAHKKHRGKLLALGDSLQVGPDMGTVFLQQMALRRAEQILGLEKDGGGAPQQGGEMGGIPVRKHQGKKKPRRFVVLLDGGLGPDALFLAHLSATPPGPIGAVYRRIISALPRKSPSYEARNIGGDGRPREQPHS